MDEFARSLVPVDIEEEMRSSYMDYSMSVIIGRALPDVRDGLKPVHRRILYAMFREGNLSTRRYSKCAGVVGEVLKKYHPHGDSAVYDALVRMAQPWNMRYVLVDGQGNFGSVDGDPAAAYRYTESRMSPIAEELLADIDMDTVAFQANFDGSTEEPVVLPAAFPNLLVNGSDGIAVGMATKIPPHNLREVIDGLTALIDDPDVTVDTLMQHIPGPDFPTAGTVYGRLGVREAYLTGRGKIIVRGKAEIEIMDNDRESIIIDELPFQVNKARLVEDIATLVKDKKIEGISALRDESDRHGMRIVMELKRDAVGVVVLNHLYKHTALQSTFGVILLAIDGNRPVVLNLKEMLDRYLQHRKEVTVRRCRYELRKAKERLHILDGYLKALDQLDAVIALIRKSGTPDDARTGLMASFGFSEIQAQAILDLRLQRLTGMERQKIEEEHAGLVARTQELEAILADQKKLVALIRRELVAIKEKYGDDRRTRFTEATGEVSIQDLITDESQAVTLSVAGYVKRTSLTEYREQRRGGFGTKGMNTRDEDSVREIFIANTLTDLLVFTRKGQVYKLPVHQIPAGGRDARGKPIVNLVPLEPEDSVVAIISIEDFNEEQDALFCSKQGLVKRTRLSEFVNMRTSGLRAYDNADGDELLTVVLARPHQDVLIVTKQGKSIRFAGDDVRHMGRVARGVRGITLREGDEIVGLQVLESDPSMLLLTVTERGYGKRTELGEYRVQGRGGQGVRNMIVDERNGSVVGSTQVSADDRIMLITNNGRVIKCPVAGIREVGRVTKGVTLMRVEEGERVVSVTRVVEADEELPPEGEAEGVGELEAPDDGAAEDPGPTAADDDGEE
jgi:DNA gyrase subunit A